MARIDWEIMHSDLACPVEAIGDCPYCDRQGYCHLEHPKLDCDDYYAAEEEEFEDEDE